jgi:uncharacterized protein YqeY
MLIEKLKSDMITARKGSNPVVKSLMVTLYSEASMVGKNKRNGDPTDDEVISTVRKFIANAEDTCRLLTERGQSCADQQVELQVLQGYVPQQMDRSALESVVHSIIHEMKLEGPKAMGQVMSELKKNYTGRYDGKLASEVVKSILV